MNQKIGLSSWDNSTFILFRRSDQIVRKYNALGLSTSILVDAFIKKKDSSDIILCGECLNHYANHEYDKIKLKKLEDL
jgi:hypothetical protein